jgi:hypothetical protein
MPRRSNEFQHLVFLVRRQLAGEATVTESEILRELASGKEREVDVCLEGVVGGHPVKVCLECCDRKRPADVSWVEAMKAKHDSLPTNALLLVSRNGFTSHAKQKAAEYGLPAISFDDIEAADIPGLFAHTSSLWRKEVTVTAERVFVGVRPTGSCPAERVRVTPDNLVYRSDHTEMGPIIGNAQKRRRPKATVRSRST